MTKKNTDGKTAKNTKKKYDKIIAVRLSEDLIQHLEHLAAAEERTVSQVIRIMIKNFIKV